MSLGKGQRRETVYRETVFRKEGKVGGGKLDRETVLAGGKVSLPNPPIDI